jgi:hypothetical protein
MKQFYIWSIEHNQWWAPGEWGYTPHWSDAGTYDEDRAHLILAQANRVQVNECLIPVESVEPPKELV